MQIFSFFSFYLDTRTIAKGILLLAAQGMYAFVFVFVKVWGDETLHFLEFFTTWRR